MHLQLSCPHLTRKGTGLRTSKENDFPSRNFREEFWEIGDVKKYFCKDDVLQDLKLCNEGYHEIFFQKDCARK